MQQKIRVNNVNGSDNKNTIKIGTHNGIFHCDEVVACALLAIFARKYWKDSKELSIIRTRDPKRLEECDICVDIGEGKFDHHYKDFNEHREGENGALFASAGLIFKYFGRKLIEMMGNNLTEEEVNSLYKEIDEEIIKPIDMQDNGKQDYAHPFDYIPLFNPSWHEEQNLRTFDNSFEHALEMTINAMQTYLERKISGKKQENISEKNGDEQLNNLPEIVVDYLPTLKANIGTSIKNNTDLDEIQGCTLDRVTPELLEYVRIRIEPFVHEHCFITDAKEIITQKIHTLVDDYYGNIVTEQIISKSQTSKHTILRIPSQTINWKEAVCNFNKTNSELGIDFVIYPYPNGGYALECVPKSIDNKFSNRIALLKKDKLPEGITKIHPRLFFATGEYNALMQLANEAIASIEDRNMEH